MIKACLCFFCRRSLDFDDGRVAIVCRASDELGNHWRKPRAERHMHMAGQHCLDERLALDIFNEFQRGFRWALLFLPLGRKALDQIFGSADDIGALLLVHFHGLMIQFIRVQWVVYQENNGKTASDFRLEKL